MSTSSLSRSAIALLLVAILAECSCVLAQSTDEQPTQRTPILRYTPSKPWAVVMGALYALTSIGCIVWGFRYWGRYMLAIIIGGGFYSLGLFLRIVYAGDMTSVIKYAIMNLIILLSPCGFIAGVYMLLSRLAVHLDATEHLSISPRKLTKIFVWSDVVTFWVQASGGGLTAVQNANMRNIGSKVFLGGLIAQLISFLIYTYVFVTFVYRVRKHRRDQWDNRPQGIMRHWLALVIGMAISCVFIIIRSVFRAIENGEGRDGTLASKEIYFYILDCIVLWIAVTVFLITWPPKYLTNYKSGSLSKDSIPMSPNTNGNKA